MTLPLYGTASLSAGFRSDKARSVIRLRAVDSSAERHASDFVLVKTLEEFNRAAESNWPVP
jgi:hypothetical protein